jgi:diguanylate cyclase (GGDEF)-like protein/PAS domain S-box-containing protein
VFELNKEEEVIFEHKAPAYQSGDGYLRSILETTQDGFIVVAADEAIVDANSAFFRMTGYAREDLKTMYLKDLIPPDYHGIKAERYQKLNRNGADLFETKNRNKDGTVTDVEISSSVLNRDPFTVVCFLRDITDRKSTEKSMLQMRDLLEFILEHNRSAIAIHDKNRNYMYVSRPYIEIFRVKDTDIIGKYHYDVFPNLPQALRDVHTRVLQGEVMGEEESLYTYDDGTSNWMRWDCRPWFESGGGIGGFVLYAEVITERKLMEQALWSEKEQFKTTLLSVGDGVISADNRGVITVMNPIAEKLTGWASKDAKGRPLEEVCRVIREDTGRVNASYLKKVLGAGRIVELSNNIMLLSRAGDEIPVEISAAPIRDSSGNIAGVVIVIRDFTEKRAKQRQIEYLSFNDHLTGLYNRRYMEESFRRLDVRKNLPLSLMVIDVNGLKLTNDAFGHEMGDRLLKKVADLIKKACRVSDVVGRMGGDEFCILLPHTDARHAETVMDRIKAAASRLKLEPVIVSLAVGFAVKSSPEQDIKAVMIEADNLMYRDKIRYGRAMRSQTIETILHNININYEQEQVHIERVSQFSESIAKAMGFPDKDVADVKTVGALHDIGKIMVPPQILNKTEKLTKEDWSIIKRHPEIGYQMLKSVDEYVQLAEYVLYHHERWDGKGYPEGLTGDSIPLYSRIIAVADAYEAMTAVRPYQKTKTPEDAVAELQRCSGTQFDPGIVQVFVEKVLK